MGCDSLKQSKNKQIPSIQNQIKKIPDIREDELYPNNGIPSIPLKLVKSVCKIITEKGKGTGFFVINLNKNKYLLTNNHVLNSDMLTPNSIIKIEIHDGQNFEFNLNNIKDNIKFYKKPIDITIININDLNELYNCVEFLEIDYYNKNDYNAYQYENVVTFGYPFGNEISCSPGKIVSILENEFEHNCHTEKGFSGSPIILASNSKVIGVHKEGIIDKNLNAGTLLGIIGELNENKDNNNINNQNNEIFNAIDKMNIKIMQMKKSICRVESRTNRGTIYNGTGFLCLIEESDKNLSIPALCTCEHIWNKRNIGTVIKLIFYDKEK